MDFLKFWKSLTSEEKDVFCKKVKLTKGYITTRLIYKSRKPTLERIDLMVSASNGKLTHQGLIHFFINNKKASSATNT
ncbi:XRE family transcriptional regulator [Acinetobacter sp. HY1485]|uniref:XRE family transcriptional regulator n=1 Tax=Acinetobacter sp. HY1485 TaxID=2970918 RepID=UPI0022B9C2B6|nr:XRE family transcriptional regulator [Acinetobacter sp. HY1485]